jgi:hypothetical protein
VLVEEEDHRSRASRHLPAGGGARAGTEAKTVNRKLQVVKHFLKLNLFRKSI